MTRIKSSDKWKGIPWKKLQRDNFRLQLRIFKAQKEGDHKRVRMLQKLLLNSKAAKLLAVRQVTQLNTGKRTPGVDGKTALTPKERLEVVEKLDKWKEWKHQKLRRVWIPKPNGEMRGLGIPTIADRAYQCLLKYALEPAVEANFDARSYGFRPGRGAHDVQRLLFTNLSSNKNGISKRILEMDIAKCFDEINHQDLMKRIPMPPAALIGIWRALKVGVKAECGSREKGTPQGGVISPVLANIALHGLESIDKSIRGIRYADDLVFILKPGQDEIKLREKIDQFLAIRGLKVKEAKTRLVKSTEGFDFLGWNFRVRMNGKFTSTPSDKNYKAIKEKIKRTMTEKSPLVERITRIGTQVRGWRNYHKYCDLTKHNLYLTEKTIWKKINANKSYDRFKTDKAIRIAFPKISRSVGEHIMVRGDKTPFDGDLLYWAKRTEKYYDGPMAKQMRKQEFKCGKCHLYFQSEDIVELHHVDGNHDNWKPKNLMALHRHCHQMVHGQRLKQGT